MSTMSARAKYVLIAEALESQILSMGSNSLLPTEQQLTRRFQVSRVTVRRALSFLEKKGLLSRERGRGTIVNPPKITRQLLPVCSLEEDMREQALKLETRLCQWQPEIEPPDHVRRRLRLLNHESVAFLSLTRAVEDRVICYDARYIPSSLGKDFNPQLACSRSVSHVLQDLSNLAIDEADCEAEITPTPYDVSKILGLLPGVLILAHTFTHYFENGEPAEVGVVSYRMDLVTFRFSVSGASVGLRLREQSLRYGSGSPMAR